MEVAAIAKDFMEENTTSDDLRNHLTLEKIKKLIEAKENAKRSMAELTRAQEEPAGTTNKLSNYHKGKSFKLQKTRDNPRGNKGTPGRRGTKPDSTPTCTFCNYHIH